MSPPPLERDLPAECRRWLVTGAAGFVGSHLVESLLARDQDVVGLDNLSTGRKANLADVESRIGSEKWRRFRFVEGDVRDLATCRAACEGMRYVLHQAALGSVPRSIADPGASHASNVTGTVQMLTAARDAGIDRFVFASSSSVYGDDPGLPKVEDRTGRPLSPYAVTKVAGERYVEVFHDVYDLPVVTLRYFNVFGPRQDPEGPYAAVIPRWIGAMLAGGPVEIYGDGETSRDFCYVANVVQANLRAATVEDPRALGAPFNVARGKRTTLNELFGMIRTRIVEVAGVEGSIEPVHRDFRPGDVRHSLAATGRAEDVLGYRPSHGIGEGLDETVRWFVEAFRRESAARVAP